MSAKKLAIWLLLLLLSASPGQALAHSTLLKADPAPDSKLDSPPAQVSLTFNERLEKELYGITVVDQRGHSVTNNKAVMSEDQRQVNLRLPKLSDGIYTVSYRIISADGHPVSGSYVITVGQPQEGGSAVPALPDNLHADHAAQGQVEFWAVRIFYYLMLLFVTGWTAWTAVLRREPEAVRQLHRYWSRHLLWFYFIALAGVGLLQFSELLSGFNFPDLLTLLTRTSVGLSWLLSALLAVIGLLFLQRSRWFDGLWAMLTLACKSFSGHAMAFDPPIRTVLLDTLHLFAAALWAGGLLYLLIIGFKFPERKAAFIRLFAPTALLSIAALAVTGTLSTLIFLPKLSYLLYTAWGYLLIAKVALVAGVVITAAVLRRYIRKHRGVPPKSLLHLDFVLMVGIVGIVGVLTFLNPFPVNEPLHWHVMGEKVHMTAEISPKAPGPNDFTVTVWLPERMKGPKQVQMLLTNKDNKDMGAIQVPLAPGSRGNEPPDFFSGFKKYVFTSSGPYLPFPGTWEVEVRVMDEDDNETVYDKDIIVY